MPDWSAPQRPAAYAEQALLAAILDGTYPAAAALPAERELAARLGVTRPTLREALQRLERDGWITIRQGKPTLVNDFRRDGGLNVLNTLVRSGQPLPPNFIPNLLEVRLAMAPAYTRSAITQAADQVAALLAQHTSLEDTPAAYAAYDWTLHHTLTIASGNPIYTFILNGFAGFYQQMACLYFTRPQARRASRLFYAALLEAAQTANADQAEQITRQVMRQSIEFWRHVSQKVANTTE